MSEGNKTGGNRQAPREKGFIGQWWENHCSWVEQMTTGQRLRYRLLQIMVILSILVIGAYFALSTWMKVPEVPGKVESGVIDIQQPSPEKPGEIKSERKEGVYTFLLAGKDVASGATDTMLLLSYDINEKTIRGMNLPRDTMVNVSTSAKRLNTVYAFNRTGKTPQEKTANGMNALKEEVGRLTGVTPDFYVLVEWDAIGRLVDALGGVEFEVPFDMDYDDPYQNLHIHQKAGLRLLSGDDAMQVIRHRKNNDGSHSNGDIGRMEVQQDFLKAVVKKCLQPAIFLKISSLVEIFKENVETDLTVGNLLAFAEKAMGMDPETGIEFFTAPVAEYFMYNKAAMLTLDPQAMLDVVNEKLNPYGEDVTMEDLEILIYHSNHTFTVTNGELKDSSLGVAYTPPVSSVPEKEQESEPEPEPEPESDPELELEVPVEEVPEVIPEEPEVETPGEEILEEEKPPQEQEITPEQPQENQDVEIQPEQPDLEAEPPVVSQPVLPSEPAPVEQAA